MDAASLPLQENSGYLVIQESCSANSSRVLHAQSLSQAVDFMIRLFVGIRLQRQPAQEAVFDAEEMIAYFEGLQDIRYLEAGAVGEQAPFLHGVPLTTMRTYSRKALLGELVDRLASEADQANPERPQ